MVLEGTLGYVQGLQRNEGKPEVDHCGAAHYRGAQKCGGVVVRQQVQWEMDKEGRPSLLLEAHMRAEVWSGPWEHNWAAVWGHTLDSVVG